MSIDTSRLENLRSSGGKRIARCPACAELGADKTGNHLFIADDGRFGCIAFAGPTGDTHRKRIRELTGETTTVDANFTITAKPCHLPGARPRSVMNVSPAIPLLRPLSTDELDQVACARGWHRRVGLIMLAERGLLWHGMVWDHDREWPAWIITDSNRHNAQARRLDGKLWEGIDAKAKTLRGCDTSWPIGASEIGEHRFVVLCEGQPDFCAALQVAWWDDIDVAPVCMTGAGNSIRPDALPRFAGKHVRIAVHDDKAGRTAGERWAKALYSAGAALVDSINFAGLTKADGQPVKDLADFATMLDPESPPSFSVLAEMEPLQPKISRV